MVSPDTIVPDPSNPQSYNRYSYARNNPVNFNDPTGHRECNIATGDCNDPEPHEVLPVRTPIEVNDWERQLLAITAFVEMHGHGNVQAEAIIWVAFNRMEGTRSLEGLRSYPNSNFSGTSQIAGYILSTNQFAIGHVIMDEYGLLEIISKDDGGNDNFSSIEGMTVQEVVAQAYASLNNYYHGEVDAILEEVVNPVIDAYNSGQTDPTFGSTFYGHLTPAEKPTNLAYLQNYAESLEVSAQVQYRIFASTKLDLSGSPVNYLIVNNLIALPQVDETYEQ